MVDHRFFFLFFSPSFVVGHYCPRFTYDKELQEQELPLLAPSSFHDFISTSAATNFLGVTDCHKISGENEIALSAICKTDATAFTTADDSCMCQALFEFRGCSSCTLCERTDDYGFGITSFSANCSGIYDKYPDCKIECGFKTSGCFSDTKARSGTYRQITTSFVPILVVTLNFILL